MKVSSSLAPLLLAGSFFVPSFSPESQERISPRTRLTKAKRSAIAVKRGKAYDTVLRFLPQTLLSPEDEEQINSKLAELKFVLHALRVDV
jgi:hypothetical protein